MLLLVAVLLVILLLLAAVNIDHLYNKSAVRIAMRHRLPSCPNAVYVTNACIAVERANVSIGSTNQHPMTDRPVEVTAFGVQKAWEKSVMPFPFHGLEVKRDLEWSH